MAYGINKNCERCAIGLPEWIVATPSKRKTVLKVCRKCERQMWKAGQVDDSYRAAIVGKK